MSLTINNVIILQNSCDNIQVKLKKISIFKAGQSKLNEFKLEEYASPLESSGNVVEIQRQEETLMNVNYYLANEHKTSKPNEVLHKKVKCKL